MASNYCTLRCLNTSQIARAFAIGLLLVLLVCSGVIVVAQEPSNKRGFQPGNSYALGDFETINTTNGNVILNLNLGVLAPGRSGLTGSMGVRYNSKLYDSDVVVSSDHSGQQVPQSFITQSDTGGWQRTSSLDYQIKVVNRSDVEGGPYECVGNEPVENNRAVYVWKVKVVYPDGAEREFRPEGFHDEFADGFFNVDPTTGEIRGQSTGQFGCTIQSLGSASNPLNYFSTDGTYTRLTITRGTGWVLSFPDGTRIEGSGFGGGQYLYDRNGNYLTFGPVTLPNGHVTTGLIDQFGRYVAMESNPATREDDYYSLGFNGQSLKWTVKWKTIAVLKPYETSPVSGGRGRGTTSSQTWDGAFDVVERVTLPSQAGSLSYQFSYNGVDADPNQELTNYTNGWGEVSGITLPTGAQVSYEYERDATHPADGLHPIRPHAREVLDNSIDAKTVTYQAEYDGASSPVTETWSYAITRFGSTVTSPDGGVHMQSHRDFASGQPDAGLVYFEQLPSGEQIERTWQPNQPSVTTGMLSSQQGNFYVKREMRSIPNAAGTMVLTAIKEYDYDKNGNVTRVAEFDWIPYATAHATGFSTSGLSPIRISYTSYYNATVAAEDNTTEQSNAYWNLQSKRIRNLASRTEIQANVAQNLVTVACSEFSYDDTEATGNLIQQLSWDSTKGPLSSQLNGNNSVSVQTQYNQYGAPILVTDGRGIQTQLIYGNIGTFIDLYPTVTKSAYGTAVQRTETREYDLSSGLVKKVTDTDNNVSTSMSYDDLGRLRLVKAADGIPGVEADTVTEYFDADRRIVTRSDLNTVGDGKLVSIQHYDQLGRIRLARQLEDSTQSATDETAGIKVQTRYLLDGTNHFSYALTSNPYRAATSVAASAEATMGWTRSKRDVTGRVVEVQTFAGATLPGPWSNNITSTGAVTTAYDANFTTVTDQALKVRRSMTDALGRLIRVDEPNGGGSLGTTDLPNQSTSYEYDALDNLTVVHQGAQTRTFVYDSLRRLTSANNPESGTVNYQYDPNGNLLVKTDARGVAAHYEYDPLSRVKRRWYNSDSSITAVDQAALPSGVGATDEVKYAYDALPAGAPLNFVAAFTVGRITAVTYGGGSAGDYFSYDALGRVKTKIQHTGSVDFQIGPVIYNLAGRITSEPYPSSRTVTYTYDGAGRMDSFTGNLGDGATRTYSTGIIYSPFGGMAKEQFGTSTAIYNKRFYNSRGQLAEIREGTTYTGPSDTGWQRGAIINHYSNHCWGLCENHEMSDNNGNLRIQQHWIPKGFDANGNVNDWSMFEQQYDYDALNRLQRVADNLSTPSWQQHYTYDRWGNRTVDTDTSGLTPRSCAASVATNKLYASGETDQNHPLIDYDAAGNQKKDWYTDNYSGVGKRYDRVYDAENRMTSSTTTFSDNSTQPSTYVYDGDGRRIKRSVGGVETWQVYGLGGELLAEYAANAAPATPQKEYGYRNGELLVTADAPTGAGPTNVALAANGGIATASSSYPSTPTEDDSPATTNNGDRKGKVGNLLSVWNDAAPGHTFDDWLQVDFNGSKTISEIDVFTLQDNWQNPSEPTEAMTFSNYGITGYDVQYWNGSSWATVPNGSVTGNNKVWRKFTFAAVTTSKVRVLSHASGDGYSRVAELEAWTANSASVHWLVTDQLGTPRMVFDQSGDLTVTNQNGQYVSGATRHDYLPFGEELFAGTGGRTTAQGYGVGDGIRQHFISKERDTETGLDYFGARYFSSTQGRFTGVDPVGATKYHLLDPQLWNAYSYGLNNPLTIIDVDGRFPWTIFIRSFIFRSMVGAFGYGYRGDSRGPSTDESATARIRMQFTLDIDRSSAHLDKLRSDPSIRVLPGWEKSEEGQPRGDVGQVRTGENNSKSVETWYAGNNPLAPASPDIDVHSSLTLTEDTSKGVLSISGQVTGDKFPSTEAFIADQSGNRVFLGAKYEEGDSLASKGRNLSGDNKANLFKIDMKIRFDKKGNFTAVISGGKTYSIKAWNKKVEGDF